MNIYNSLLDLIGNTPIIELHSFSKRLKTRIVAKLEMFNPGGSIKDRIAIHMLENAEKKGLIQPGNTIIEATSGNTGIGLALTGLIKGYKVIIVVTDKISKEKETILHMYGAKVIKTPSDLPPDHPDSCYKIAEKMEKEIPDSYFFNQYINSSNPDAHYTSTGPELWKATRGQITHFIAGMGTGGTITGTAKYLKEKNPGIKVIGVDPEGSLFHQEFYQRKTREKKAKVPGLGTDFLSDIVDFTVIDEIIVVDEIEAKKYSQKLAKEEGLIVGLSSGAVASAVMKINQKFKQDDLIAMLFPDSGKDYLSMIHTNEKYETLKS